MSESDRARWNTRYREGSYATRPHPSPLVAEWTERLAQEYPGGRALDFACGRGRNAFFLAEHGFKVDAIDISDVAIEIASKAPGGEEIEWIQGDLDAYRLDVDAYDVIVVSRFLNRERVPDLCDALRVGGTIAYEQHLTVDTSAPLPSGIGGPKSTRFRLRSNELLRLFQPLRVRYYEEGQFTDPDGTPMLLGRLVATRFR